MKQPETVRAPLRYSVMRTLGAILLSVFVGCGGPTPEHTENDVPIGDAAARLRAGDTVITTFYPTQYFAERIGGQHIKVACPLPAGTDPIFWQPKPTVIRQYQNAAVIVVNGASFEKWLDTVSLPISRMVDSSRPLRSALIQYEDAVVHAHGPKGEHSHEGIDGHTWVDPANAVIQAEEIFNALARRFPHLESELQSGFDKLQRDLSALADQLKDYQSRYKNQPILASHPAYNYVARRYGWNVKNLDLDPDALPHSDQIAGIRKMLESHPARYLLWEAKPIQETRELFKKELGLESILFSPCESLSTDDREAGENYLSIMKRNIENIRPMFE